MKNSSPGLDHIHIAELKVATLWSPDLLTNLVSLLQCIETNAKWPSNLTKGVAAFIPKDTTNPQPKADEFRPITVLPTIYRVWAATRHAELADAWFPQWKHNFSYGGKNFRSADKLAYDTCCQFEEAIRNNKYIAGLSFDLQKCFDSIPVELALHVFAMRGADLEVVNTLKSFYKAHTKHFRLDGCHSPAFKPCCGIIQGCPVGHNPIHGHTGTRAHGHNPDPRAHGHTGTRAQPRSAGTRAHGQSPPEDQLRYLERVFAHVSGLGQQPVVICMDANTSIKGSHC